MWEASKEAIKIATYKILESKDHRVIITGLMSATRLREKKIKYIKS